MDDHGSLSNGSFCGNDYESQSRMGKKYLIDCCLNWVKEYDIDAFRFDLMGVIDIDTMNTIVYEARRIKPNFMVYGEGWNMPTMLADEKKTIIANNLKTPNIAFFSDRFRDVIKGSTGANEEGNRGYGTNNTYMIEETKNVITAGIMCFGSFPYVSDPNQMINYVECHDNQTLWDKMKICNREENRETRLNRQKLINACILLSQGVPFIHAGQEFARTKNQHHNTYCAGDDINKIDYERMIQNISLVNYTKDMIKLRKNFAQFRLCTKEEIEQRISFQNMEHNILKYSIKDDNKNIDVFINPTSESLAYEYDKEVRIIANEAGYLEDEFYQRIVTINPITLVVICYEK
jgi:pullulanase